MQPKEIVKSAKKHGIEMIAITDHNTIMGGVVARQYGNSYGVKVIVGAEIKTDIGDIIGLNLTEEVRSRQWETVLDEIHDQGGMSVFPHPYRGHRKIDEVALHVDLIEVWNARSSDNQNTMAFNLCIPLGKKCVLGSDAHLYSEIGNVGFLYNKDFERYPEVLFRKSAKPWQVLSSVVIGHIKRKEIKALILEGKDYIFKKDHL
jgi:predicted metal-dependent phosphoesterase TrpH